MSNIKILVTYKEKHRIFKSDIITPIQTGRAIAREVFKEMIGDDTGDNISALNDKYCEASAMYWAWKNYDKIGNPDYIGFMHYRRQFLFDTTNLNLNFRYLASSFYQFMNFDDELLNSFADEKIKKSIQGYDYIVPAMHDVYLTNCRTVREEYAYLDGARLDIFDKFIEICKEKLVDYESEIEELEFGHQAQICCMFIMKKELFFEFCEITFMILQELVAKVDCSRMSGNALRFAGYMTEKMVTLYILHLKRKNKYRGKYINCSYVLNPDGLKFNHLNLKIKYYNMLYWLSGRKDKNLKKKYLYLKEIKSFLKNNK